MYLQPIIKHIIPVLLLLTVVKTESCKKDTATQKTPTYYNLDVPAGFPQPYKSALNPLSREGVALGRKLFFDTILSSNGRSCNTCHRQELSFSISNKSLNLSPALYQNIPPLINLAWNPDFDWIGGHTALDDVAIGDFGPLFFNSRIDEVLERLKTHSQYPVMFEAAFPGKKHFTDGIMQQEASYALAQFLRTLITAESQWDLYLQGKAQVSAEAKYGHDLFTSEKGDCFHCHSVALFTDNSFHNIGLDSTFAGTGLGRYQVTQKNTDIGLFSTPTLRNVAVTAPFMHDGRFETLEEVIEHYNSGVKKSATLDPIMTKAGKETGLNLTAFEKQCLKEFLLTLTDTTFLNNPEFRAP